MTRRYLVVYAKGHNTNTTGYAPDVLGCVSTGDTLEQMRAMTLEGLTAHFEFMAEDGEAAPEPVTLNVDFPEEDFEDMDYYVVEKLVVPMPVQVDLSKRTERRPIRAA